METKTSFVPRHLSSVIPLIETDTEKIVNSAEALLRKPIDKEDHEGFMRAVVELGDLLRLKIYHNFGYRFPLTPNQEKVVLDMVNRMRQKIKASRALGPFDLQDFDLEMRDKLPTDLIEITKIITPESNIREIERLIDTCIELPYSRERSHGDIIDTEGSVFLSLGTLEKNFGNDPSSLETHLRNFAERAMKILLDDFEQTQQANPIALGVVRTILDSCEKNNVEVADMRGEISEF